jgi:pantothenate kinase
VKEYDLFIPLYYNDGRQVEPQKFQVLQQEEILIVERDVETL